MKQMEKDCALPEDFDSTEKVTERWMSGNRKLRSRNEMRISVGWCEIYWNKKEWSSDEWLSFTETRSHFM